MLYQHILIINSMQSCRISIALNKSDFEIRESSIFVYSIMLNGLSIYKLIHCLCLLILLI